MNPEFQRNLWLELTPARLLLMTGFVLFLIAIFSAAPPGFPSSGAVATALYYFLVVLWGTRTAALSVIAEIRERTWDFQKLSAIPPFALMWGKLFGATSFTWFGGILCLPFIVYPVWRGEGLLPAAGEFAILILQGVLAQSVSLLTSLNLIRRQHNYWRLDAFLCQVMGIVAAFSVYGISNLLSFGSQSQAASFSWWGMVLEPHRFQFFSLLIFTAWALVDAPARCGWSCGSPMVPLSGSLSWRSSACMKRDLGPGLRWTSEVLRSRPMLSPCDRSSLIWRWLLPPMAWFFSSPRIPCISAG